MALVAGILLLVASGAAFAATVRCEPGAPCRGTAAADTIYGTSGTDEIFGLGGDDDLYGDKESDASLAVRKRGGEQITLSLEALRAEISEVATL